jgi:hypothetical protein
MCTKNILLLFILLFINDYYMHTFENSCGSQTNKYWFIRQQRINLTNFFKVCFQCILYLYLNPRCTSTQAINLESSFSMTLK